MTAGPVCVQVGANVTILKMWRFMAAELNPALGRPRLADPKMVLRIRAGCVPIRTVMVRKTFIEKRASEDTDSNETLKVTHTVECKEVQVLLVSSNTFPSFWILPSGGQRLPRAQVLIAHRFVLRIVSHLSGRTATILVPTVFQCCLQWLRLTTAGCRLPELKCSCASESR